MCLGLFGEHAAWDAQLARLDAVHTCPGLSGDGKECKDEVVWRPCLSPPGFPLRFRLPSSQVGATVVESRRGWHVIVREAAAASGAI